MKSDMVYVRYEHIDEWCLKLNDIGENDCMVRLECGEEYRVPKKYCYTKEEQEEAKKYFNGMFKNICEGGLSNG